MLILFFIFGLILCILGCGRFDTDIFLAGMLIIILSIGWLIGDVLHLIFR